MINLVAYEVWFLTGSQHLYGPEALEQVAQYSREIAAALNDAPGIPVRVVFKPEAIHAVCLDANAACAHPRASSWISRSTAWISPT